MHVKSLIKDSISKSLTVLLIFDTFSFWLKNLLELAMYSALHLPSLALASNQKNTDTDQHEKLQGLEGFIADHRVKMTVVLASQGLFNVDFMFLLENRKSTLVARNIIGRLPQNGLHSLVQCSHLTILSWLLLALKKNDLGLILCRMRNCSCFIFS